MRRTLTAAATVVLLLVAGCSSSATRRPAADAGPSPSTVAGSAAPAPAVPRSGSCHDLTVTEATEPVDRGDPVPCGRPHTSVTFKVGQLSPVVDGHLLAVDSRTVRAQIARSCPDFPGALLGGDRTAQQLSRFEVVWFSPSLEQADAGANWYRCDVVAVRSEGRLLPLPVRLDGVLDQPGALNRFGTCGTTAPDARGFARVVCSERHSWRAVATIDLLPAGTHYLGKRVEATANAACKGIASRRANGSLKYTWSFQWPTRAQWSSGQRHGYCWVPQA
ncbi:MAG: hypothetical protein JWP24_2680 [Marmoricola sp.]|nr:hypothetical protein [Marmoricola sp.]